MLSRDDHDVVERDPALPALATLLDPAAFGAALRESYPHLAVGDLTGWYLRYKPGTSCLAAFDAVLGGDRVILHAITAADPIKLRRRRHDRTDHGLGAIRLGELPILVRGFPADGRLKSLGQLLDPARRARMLPAPVAEGSLETIRYKPERRFVGRLTGATGPFAVKLHAPGRIAAAADGATAFRSEGALQFAPVVHADEGLGIVVQRWMPGRLLADCQADPEWDPREAQGLGQALAQLHAQRPRGIAPDPRPDGGLLELGESLELLLPSLRGTARTHAATLVGALHEIAEPDTVIHGDCYAKQILLDGPRITVLDCDQARAGDPAEDLGTFRAHLLRDVLRHRVTRERADRIWDAVRSGYGASGGDWDLRIQLFTAIGCLRLGPDPFRHREADWAEGTRALVRLSLAAMAPILSGRPAAAWA